MFTKIQKWGSRLAAGFPKAFAQDAQLKNDPVVEVSLVDGQINLKAVAAQVWSLEQLLSGGSSINLHQETQTGDALGNEVW